jgi:NAD(P)H-hydrate epimerase
MRILNAEQMREADRRTIQDIGIASLVLMENAGRQVVAAIESLYPDLAERRIAIVCGKGNNGGDGFVVARTLQQRGFDVSVFVIGRSSKSRPTRASTSKSLDAPGRRWSKSPMRRRGSCTAPRLPATT